MALNLGAQLGAPKVERSSPRGRLLVWCPTPKLLVTDLYGYLDVDMAQAIAQCTYGLLMGSPKVAGFHDWRELVDYQPEARSFLLKFCLETGRRFEAVHMIAQHRLIVMGIRAAAIVVTSVKLHDTDSTFRYELGRYVGAASDAAKAAHPTDTLPPARRKT